MLFRRRFFDLGVCTLFLSFSAAIFAHSDKQRQFSLNEAVHFDQFAHDVLRRFLPYNPSIIQIGEGASEAAILKKAFPRGRVNVFNNYRDPSLLNVEYCNFLFLLDIDNRFLFLKSSRFLLRKASVVCIAYRDIERFDQISRMAEILEQFNFRESFNGCAASYPKLMVFTRL